jgi:hypothetical protein
MPPRLTSRELLSCVTIIRVISPFVLVYLHSYCCLYTTADHLLKQSASLQVILDERLSPGELCYLFRIRNSICASLQHFAFRPFGWDYSLRPEKGGQNGLAYPSAHSKLSSSECDPKAWRLV